MAEPDVTETDLIRWSEALAGIARTGLGFTQSLYERERFEEVLKVAADIAARSSHRTTGAAGASASADVGPSSEDLVSGWLASVGHGIAGYVTPKVAVGAVVGNDHGELLLIQRGDSGVWLYPTGWADIGYSPAEVVTKEVEEETGILVEALRIIAVIDSLRLGAHGLPFYSVVFHCQAIGGSLARHPLETKDVGWFGPDNLPSPLAGGGRWRDMAFAAVSGSGPLEAAFDRPRATVWEQ